jgi:hypothetical protein
MNAALGAGLIAVGLGAVVAPRTSAVIFGVPVADRSTSAYVRATGARDVILGAIVLASLQDPRALRRVLAWTSLVGLTDAIVLAAARGPRVQHVAHLGGFAALAVAALAVRR